jgi:Domain of unknown function (DUF4062)
MGWDMVPQIRYQVFVSSTYEDLRVERQQATQAILEAGHFPSGMELFPASDQSQWELIKKVIEESDYYIVLIGGRYGSVSEDGTSFTEMEYDYAAQIGVPILGFVRDDIGNIQSSFVEKSEEGRRKLDEFRKKVMSRHCRIYGAPSDLGMLVMKSLISESRIRPRVGWVKADQARSEDDIAREHETLDELKAARSKIVKYERELRDRATLGDEISLEQLAQGDDQFEIDVRFVDSSKALATARVPVSWDQIFRIIGPSMYGYIMRRSEQQYSQNRAYSFEENIIDYVRGIIVDRVQSRRIALHSGQVDQIIIQLKELGLVMYAETDDGFRGVTLTELGERRLTRISVKARSGNEIVVKNGDRQPASSGGKATGLK